ncbi:hypothetical protein [Endozoicomonas sp. Mp262]|uniref:hypothetical protein n=1 Tax=Endozoicomonas sp. Mp262 TaxID=2919499 RepID=UPI0021D82A63
MTTANFFRWQRGGFEMSFLRLRSEQSNGDTNHRVRYDVTILDEGHLVAALYDLSVPYHPSTERYAFEKQCIEAVINFITSESQDQVVTNWRHDLRRERLIELAKDLDAWQTAPDTSSNPTP